MDKMFKILVLSGMVFSSFFSESATSAPKIVKHKPFKKFATKQIGQPNSADKIIYLSSDKKSNLPKYYSFSQSIDGGTLQLGQSQIYTFYFYSNTAAANQPIDSLSITGSPEVTIVNDYCTGAVLSGGSGCYFGLKYAPTSVGVANATFVLTWHATFNNGWAPDNGSHTIYFTASSYNKPVECLTCEKGSLIRVDNQSLSEHIGVVGTPVDLIYSSEFAPEHLTTTGDLAQVSAKYSFNQEGWTNSLQHLYSKAQHRLFLGTGTSVGRDYFTQADGTLLVVSSNRDEVYIFSEDGKHLQTLTFLTGAVKYNFTYDSNDRLIQITDAYNNITTFNRDSSGKLTSIVSPFGQTTTIAVGINGLISSITNPQNESHQLTYKPGTGLLQTFTKPGLQVSTFSYDTDGKLLQDLGNGGNYWSLTPGSNGALTKSSQMNRQTLYTMGRDANGNYTRNEAHPSGFTSSTFQGYYDDGGSSSAIYSDWSTMGSDARFGYNAKKTTSYTYTEAGINSVTNFSQSANYPVNVQPSYFNFATLIEAQNTSGRIITTSFDNTTKTQTTASAEGATKKTIFNNLEQPTSMQIGNDTATTMSYDTLGRLSQIAQGTQNQITYAYHSTTGFLQSVTNGRNETTAYVRDLAGRVTSMILPGNRMVQYAYDANGNLISVTPPNRPVHNFEFNAMELNSKYAPPFYSTSLSKDTTYSYNLDKQLTQITLPNTQTISYNYDATKGLLNSISTSWGNYFYNYLTNSYLVGTMGSSYSIRNDFTYRGEKVASDTVIYGPNNFKYGKVSFGFDNDHRITSRTVEGNNPASADVTTITLNNDSVPVQYGDMSLSYDYPSGRLATTNISGFTDARTYDSYGNLQSYTTSYNNAAVYSYTLTRDNMSRITEVSETIQGVTKNYVYTYNTAGQLTAVTENGNQTASFSYDDNGNRTSSTINGTTYASSFDNQDRMLSFGSNSYSYTRQGELYQTQNSLSATTTFTFDPFGNLYKILYPNTTESRYFYDAKQRLAGRYFPTNYTRIFLYEDDLRIAATAFTNGQIQKTYYYATNAMTPDYMKISGINYRIVTNHLGSPRLVIRLSDGQVMQKMDYNVLGKVTSDTSPMFQPFGFAGGTYDSDSGLVHFGARKYDTFTGRWISKDPIGFNGGDTNLYGYVMNDPVNFVDPSGLWGFQVGVSASAFIGVGGGGVGAGLAVAGKGFSITDVNSYFSSQFNAGAGLAIGTGFSASYTHNATCLKDLEGRSFGAGVDSPFGGISYSYGSAGSTIGFSSSSLGAAAYGNVSNTKIGSPIVVTPQRGK